MEVFGRKVLLAAAFIASLSAFGQSRQSIYEKMMSDTAGPDWARHFPANYDEINQFKKVAWLPVPEADNARAYGQQSVVRSSYVRMIESVQKYVEAVYSQDVKDAGRGGVPTAQARAMDAALARKWVESVFSSHPAADVYADGLPTTLHANTALSQLRAGATNTVYMHDWNASGRNRVLAVTYDRTQQIYNMLELTSPDLVLPAPVRERWSQSPAQQTLPQSTTRSQQIDRALEWLNLNKGKIGSLTENVASIESVVQHEQAAKEVWRRYLAPVVSGRAPAPQSDLAPDELKRINSALEEKFLVTLGLDAGAELVNQLSKEKILPSVALGKLKSGDLARIRIRSVINAHRDLVLTFDRSRGAYHWGEIDPFEPKSPNEVVLEARGQVQAFTLPDIEMLRNWYDDAREKKKITSAELNAPGANLNSAHLEALTPARKTALTRNVPEVFSPRAQQKFVERSLAEAIASMQGMTLYEPATLINADHEHAVEIIQRLKTGQLKAIYFPTSPGAMDSRLPALSLRYDDSTQLYTLREEVYDGRAASVEGSRVVVIAGTLGDETFSARLAAVQERIGAVADVMNHAPADTAASIQRKFLEDRLTRLMDSGEAENIRVRNRGNVQRDLDRLKTGVLKRMVIETKLSLGKVKKAVELTYDTKTGLYRFRPLDEIPSKYLSDGSSIYDNDQPLGAVADHERYVNELVDFAEITNRLGDHAHPPSTFEILKRGAGSLWHGTSCYERLAAQRVMGRMNLGTGE